MEKKYSIENPYAALIVFYENAKQFYSWAENFNFYADCHGKLLNAKRLADLWEMEAELCEPLNRLWEGKTK